MLIWKRATIFLIDLGDIIMKAIIYARFSSEKQNEANIEGQLRECMDYANFNDIEVTGNYINRAQFAKTGNRPNFQKND